jgi:hypothetical protein
MDKEFSDVVTKSLGDIWDKGWNAGRSDALKELREKLPNTISHDWSEPVIDDDFIEGKEHGWNSCLSEVIKLIEELRKVGMDNLADIFALSKHKIEI